MAHKHPAYAAGVLCCCNGAFELAVFVLQQRLLPLATGVCWVGVADTCSGLARRYLRLAKPKLSKFGSCQLAVAFGMGQRGHSIATGRGMSA